MEAYEREQPDKLVLADIPLMYESGLESLYEEIMVVYVPRDIQLQRLMLRDGLTEEQAGLRLSAQMDIEQRKTWPISLSIIAEHSLRRNDKLINFGSGRDLHEYFAKEKSPAHFVCRVCPDSVPQFKLDVLVLSDSI